MLSEILSENIDGYDRVKLNNYFNRMYSEVHKYRARYKDITDDLNSNDFLSCLSMDVFSKKYEIPLSESIRSYH